MINNTYLQKESIKTIKKELKKTGAVRLDYLLQEKEFSKLLEATNKKRFTKIKIPNQFSFGKTKPPKEFRAIKSYVENFAKVKTQTLKKFAHKDYTLISDNQEKNIAFFFLLKKWNVSWGGNLIAKNNNKTLVFPPNPNTLVILKKEKCNEFIQYINHITKKESFYVLTFR